MTVEAEVCSWTPHAVAIRFTNVGRGVQDVVVRCEGASLATEAVDLSLGLCGGSDA